jgi:hypothetical protein
VGDDNLVFVILEMIAATLLSINAFLFNTSSRKKENIGDVWSFILMD